MNRYVFHEDRIVYNGHTIAIKIDGEWYFKTP